VADAGVDTVGDELVRGVPFHTDLPVAPEIGM
jgi:hypothetical protein